MSFLRITRVASHQRRLLVWDILAAVGFATAFAALTSALF
jgi:hypothetical protein